MKSYSDYEAVTAIVRGLLVVALVVSQLKPQWLPRWPLTVTQGGWPSNWCCLCVPGILISTYTEVPDLHIPSINLPVYVKKKPFQLPKPRYLSVVLPKIRQQTLCSHAGAMGLLRRPPVGRWWGHWWLLTRYPLVPPPDPWRSPLEPARPTYAFGYYVMLPSCAILYQTHTEAAGPCNPLTFYVQEHPNYQHLSS